MSSLPSAKHSGKTDFSLPILAYSMFIDSPSKIFSFVFFTPQHLFLKSNPLFLYLFHLYISPYTIVVYLPIFQVLYHTLELLKCLILHLLLFVYKIFLLWYNTFGV